MWKVTLKGLFAKKFRLALTSLAVVLGVAFMAGTFVLTDTLGNVFDDLFANTTKGVDAVVRARKPFDASGNDNNQSTRPPVPESLVSTVQSAPGVARAQGGVFGAALVKGKDGDFIQHQAPTFGTSWYPRNDVGEPIARPPARSPAADLGRGRPRPADLRGREVRARRPARASPSPPCSRVSSPSRASSSSAGRRMALPVPRWRRSRHAPPSR